MSEAAALREALLAWINKPQPLGIFRPAYQGALALLEELESAS